jgi:ribosomal protein S18 acetylase RimI-like enzyme
VTKLLATPGTTFLVAETRGHMIGFAQMTGRRDHAMVPWSAPTELNRLYIQRPFFGQGVGSALLAQAEAAARTDGAAMWLTAWSGNARALAFYAGQGYEELAKTLFTFEEDRYETRLLAKPLG